MARCQAPTRARTPFWCGCRVSRPTSVSAAAAAYRPIRARGTTRGVGEIHNLRIAKLYKPLPLFLVGSAGGGVMIVYIKDKPSRHYFMFKKTAITFLTGIVLVSPAFALGQTTGNTDLESSTVQTSDTQQTNCPNLTSTLRYRMTDAQTNGQVSDLQDWLASYYNLGDSFTSGYFGRQTQKYVMQFQREQGIDVVGFVGQLTRAAIAKVCAGGGTSTSDFSAAPSSGVAPLSVTFSGRVSINGYTIDFGDGSTPYDLHATDCQGTASYCSALQPNAVLTTHVYASAGSYTALLKDTSGAVTGRALITVGTNTHTAITASASPTQCNIPSGSNTCSATITWGAPSTQWVQVYVDGQSQSFACSLGGSSKAAPWITTTGSTFKFYAAASCSTSVSGLTPDAMLTVKGTTAAPPSPEPNPPTVVNVQASASPSPCSITDYTGMCSSTISWTAPSSQWVQVYADGQSQQFACTLGNGSKGAPWITGSGSTFKFYAVDSCSSSVSGKSPNTTLTVKGMAATVPATASITASASPERCTIMDNSGVCTSTISWNVCSQLQWVQAYADGQLFGCTLGSFSKAAPWITTAGVKFSFYKVASCDASVSGQTPDAVLTVYGATPSASASAYVAIQAILQQIQNSLSQLQH